MHFKSASVVCSGWAGARPPRAPSAPEPLRAACLPVFAAGGKTWCSGTVGQPLRHGTVRILVLRPPLRAGLAAGAGRAGRPGNASLPCRCSLLFKEARATPRAGRRRGAPPPPQRHGPAPGCALCAAAGGFSGAGAGEGCGTPVLRPLPLQGSGAPSGGRLPASPARLRLAGTRKPGARRPRLFLFVLPALCGCGWGGRPPQP